MGKRDQIRIRCLRRLLEERKTLVEAVDLEDECNRVQFKLVIEVLYSMVLV